jgi:hypothetical protein
MYPENEIESGKLEFQAEPRKVDFAYLSPVAAAT